MKYEDRDKAEHAFLIARANAIQEYAAVEQQLCMLSAKLLGAPPDLAGIVFFKITSARGRNAAIEGLIRKRFAAKHNLFWNSLVKFINLTDQKRNEIVHWLVVHEVGTSPGGMLHEFKLTPPNIWDAKPTTPQIAVEDIEAFINRCDVIMRSIGLFTMIVVDGAQHPRREAWLKIFQEALIYPLPDTHPLYRKPAAP